VVGNNDEYQFVCWGLLGGSYYLFDEFETHTRIPQMTHSVVPFSPMRSQ
jgi:hypothetical protein